MDGAAPVSAYVFCRETFDQAIAERGDALERQWDETGERDVGPFRLSEDRYRAMEKVGALRVWTVRHHGTIVGYAAFFVFFGMHNETTKAGVQDAIWLEPAHRRPGVAKRLLEFVERQLTEEGADVIHASVNEEHNSMGRLLEYLGYKPISRTYAKVLTHA